MQEESRVVLVLGAGPNLGQAVGTAFAANGYKVALASRTLSAGVSKDGFLNIQADLSTPQGVLQVFQTTTQSLGPPNVVVYNGELGR